MIRIELNAFLICLWCSFCARFLVRYLVWKSIRTAQQPHKRWWNHTYTSQNPHTSTFEIHWILRTKQSVHNVEKVPFTRSRLGESTKTALTHSKYQSDSIQRERSWFRSWKEKGNRRWEIKENNSCDLNLSLIK